MAIVGLGIDLVDVNRVERLTQRREDIFRSRILGVSERTEISSHAPRQKRNLAYTRSIAAKEAFLKALGTGLIPGMRWTEIELLDASSVRPRLAVSGEAQRRLSALQVDSIHLSVSARCPSIVATVILLRESEGEAKAL